MTKIIPLAFAATLLTSLTSHAVEKIDYSCDEIRGTVTVAFDANRPVAIYGISDDINLSEDAYEMQARQMLNDVNLRVSKMKNGIIFTLVTDDHEGETMDVRCKKK